MRALAVRLFLVRHGVTEWNQVLRFQGHTDIPLSPQGREQAGALGRRLAGEKIAAVYASDLLRARETAEIIAAYHGLAVITDPALREINFGVWEGLTLDEIKARYKAELQQWWTEPTRYRAPGGETLSEMAERVIRSVQAIVARHNGEQVVVVCHGGPVRCLLATVLGLDLNQYWRLKQDNAALNIIDFPSWHEGIVVLLNDTCHLHYLLQPRATVGEGNDGRWRQE